MTKISETKGLIPVYVPNSKGESVINVGAFSLHNDGILKIEFENNFPAVAIQRMLKRGVILSLSINIVEPPEETDTTDENNEGEN